MATTRETSRDQIEDERHVILICPKYNDIRTPLIDIVSNINPMLGDHSLELLHFILSDKRICRLSAKTLHLILQRRRDILYTNDTIF